MDKNQLLMLNSIENKNIEDCIYSIRGRQVMIDSDIPDDFSFQLQNKDINYLRCQIGTAKFLSSKRRYNPYVYTEEGIIALAGVLMPNALLLILLFWYRIIVPRANSINDDM